MRRLELVISSVGILGQGDVVWDVELERLLKWTPTWVDAHL